MSAGRWLMSVTPIPIDPLRDERIALVEHDVHRRAVLQVESLGEVHHEPALRPFAEEPEVEHVGAAVFDQEVGDYDAAGLLERHVGVLTAEDGDR
jgi:hypothetical protein